MSYLQKIYHESMYFMQIGILKNKICFYPDVQLKCSVTMFMFCSRTYSKLRYKGPKLVNLEQFWPPISKLTESFWINYRYSLAQHSL